MRILEEFWYDNLNPNEQSFDKQSRFAKVLSLLTQNEGKLLERMNEEEKEIFEKYQDCHPISCASSGVASPGSKDCIR